MALSICKAGRYSGLRCIGRSSLVGPSPCHHDKSDAHDDDDDQDHDGHDDDDDDGVMVIPPVAGNAANLLPDDPLNTLSNDDIALGLLDLCFPGLLLPMPMQC